MQNLVLREPQVRSEKEVVANERRFRVEDDVEGRSSERMYALAFRRHPYHHPTIGWMQDIQNFTTEDCRALLSHVLRAEQRDAWSSPATSTKPSCSR